MLDILILIFGILGTILIMYKDTLIDKSSNNSILQFIYNNNTIIGALCLIISYYFYTRTNIENTYIESNVPSDSFFGDHPVSA